MVILNVFSSTALTISTGDVYYHIALAISIGFILLELFMLKHITDL